MPQGGGGVWVLGSTIRSGRLGKRSKHSTCSSDTGWRWPRDRRRRFAVCVTPCSRLGESLAGKSKPLSNRRMPTGERALEELGITWVDPVPLEDAVRGTGVPALPGLYRIGRVALRHWDYIGQTGVGRMNLGRRTAMLRGVYAKQMPYRDPHTAGPGLWALRQLNREPLCRQHIEELAGRQHALWWQWTTWPRLVMTEIGNAAGPSLLADPGHGLADGPLGPLTAERWISNDAKPSPVSPVGGSGGVPRAPAARGSRGRLTVKGTRRRLRRIFGCGRGWGISLVRYREGHA